MRHDALTEIQFQSNSSLTLFHFTGIVGLLLLGYSYITQLFPALALSLIGRRRVSALAAGAGLIAGVVFVSVLTLTHHHTVELLPFLPKALTGLNDGIAALVLNIVVLLIVNALTPHRHPAPQNASGCTRTCP